MKPKFETVGEIRKGNTLFTYEDHSALEVALTLLHTRYSGMPVLSKEDRVVGVISEQDLLRAAKDSRRLEEIKVKEIMSRSPIVVEGKTTLAEASKIMEDAHIHRLPVVERGELVGTVTRHDLLRAWLGQDAEL